MRVSSNLGILIIIYDEGCSYTLNIYTLNIYENIIISYESFFMPACFCHGSS